MASIPTAIDPRKEKQHGVEPLERDQVERSLHGCEPLTLGYDVVIECSGMPAAREMAVLGTKRWGEQYQSSHMPFVETARLTS